MSLWRWRKKKLRLSILLCQEPLWQMIKVTVIPVVIGGLGVFSDMFERYIEKLDVKIAMEWSTKRQWHCLEQQGLCKKCCLSRGTGEGTFRPLMTCCYPLSKIKNKRTYQTSMSQIYMNADNNNNDKMQLLKTICFD